MWIVRSLFSVRAVLLFFVWLAVGFLQCSISGMGVLFAAVGPVFLVWGIMVSGASISFAVSSAVALAAKFRAGLNIQHLVIYIYICI